MDPLFLVGLGLMTSMFVGHVIMSRDEYWRGAGDALYRAAVGDRKWFEEHAKKVPKATNFWRTPLGDLFLMARTERGHFTITPDEIVFSSDGGEYQVSLAECDHSPERAALRLFQSVSVGWPAPEKPPEPTFRPGVPRR